MGKEGQVAFWYTTPLSGAAVCVTAFRSDANLSSPAASPLTFSVPSGFSWRLQGCWGAD